jgi:hypothetical protein
VRPTPKPPPHVTDVDSYVEMRLGDQIDEYYLKNAAEKSARLVWLRRIEAGLTLAAAGLGALAVFLEADGAAAWVPVVTAVAGAVTAHIAAERYEQDIVGFYATAQKLTALRDRWRAGTDAEGRPIDPSAFVLECENVISSENQEWMADWLESDER